MRETEEMVLMALMADKEAMEPRVLFLVDREERVQQEVMAVMEVMLVTANKEAMAVKST